jgi:hypothetical protein
MLMTISRENCNQLILIDYLAKPQAVACNFAYSGFVISGFYDNCIPPSALNR